MEEIAFELQTSSIFEQINLLKFHTVDISRCLR